MENKYSKDGITVQTYFDVRTVKQDGKYPVKIKVYQKVPRYYTTGISLTRKEWDDLSTSKSRASKEIRESIENSYSWIRDNVKALAEMGMFSFDLLNARLGKGIGSTLNDALRAKIDETEAISTRNIYKQTLKNVEEFAGKNIQFSSITPDWLRKCEKYWLKTKNNTTIGMHFRNLRIIINDVRKAGVMKEAQYPFGKGKYEIPVGQSIKKALSTEQLKAIFSYVCDNETTERYRDLWLFIYLCNGLNVADLIKLKYSNIVDGEICFVRQKTENRTKNQKLIRVALISPLQHIIDKWGNRKIDSNYIFPYLEGGESDEERYKKTRDLYKRINKRMKLIGKEIGIENITTYTARHSFASTLKRKGANISYISDCLGHSDIRTTEFYLSSFEKEDRTKNASLLVDFL